MFILNSFFERTITATALLCSVCAPVFAEQVQWNGPAGSRIKAIHRLKKEAPQQDQFSAAAASPLESETAISANLIQSPPINGVVPWIVLTATDESLDAETTGIYDAFASPYIGSPPAGTNPRTDYFLGIFDTGASAIVIGYENAVQAGLYNATYLTEDKYVTVTGVTGSVDAHVTKPYALFMGGLDVLEPNEPGSSELVLPTTSGLVGEYNVSTLIGQNPGSNPDLATAVGTPMSVFYDTHIEMDQPITVTYKGTDYTGPRINFYEKGASSPRYASFIPLELKPAGSTTVQYVTYGFNPEDLLAMFEDPFGFEMDYSPLTPSVVMGTSSQSLYFVHGVDLTEGGRSAVDKNRFMLDTGAQITVIGSRIAARLGLNPADKEFEVEIEGVTGESMMAPGFYVDSLTIPGIGDWLEYANVPVVLLDIFSPEGGTLDGIIGMNLFTHYNLILRAGGFMLDDDPKLEFQRIGSSAVGDIAPPSGDGVVNYLDYSVFSKTWLAGTVDSNWNPAADLAPSGFIDIEDLAVLANNWLSGATP